MTNLYQFGQFALDPSRRTLSRAGSSISLTPRAFDVLLFLAQNPNRLVTKEELLQAVWGDAFVEEGNLTQYISHLRKALDSDSEDTRLIVTIARKGYQFTARVTVVPRNQISRNLLRFGPLRPKPQNPVRQLRGFQPQKKLSNRRRLVSACANGSRRPRCWPSSLQPSGCIGATTAG